MQVIDRLHVMNLHQVNAAWDRWNNDPIGPHVIAFFYADPVDGSLRTAARLFLDADESRLEHLVYEVVQVFGGQIASGVSLRNELCNWAEPISDQARLIGVGVSSLDTPAGSWAQVMATATAPIHIPGRCYAALGDGTMLIVDRADRAGFGRVTVTANQYPPVAMDRLMWRWDIDADLGNPARRDGPDAIILGWLHQLYQVALREDPDAQ